MSHIVVQVDQLSKRYRIGAAQQTYTTLRERLGSATQWRKPHSDENILWALRDVSFEVQQGEVLGVIGRNGAGKSTLLKILARITRPTTGQVMIRGRVGSLLEVGTGFHPELTGRENIFLNGAILGMKREEIRRRFDEIVEFSEIARFIDTPVKRYSSGMYVRLAFGVAAHLQPDILIVDEVLAVGDIAFQNKSLGKMSSVVKDEGRTVIFVSHSMVAVRKLCDRTILLNEGRVAATGPTDEVLSQYLLEGTTEPTTNVILPPAGQQDAPGRGTCLRVLAQDRTPSALFRLGEPWRIVLEFELSKATPHVIAGVGLNTVDAIPIATYWSRPQDLQPGKYDVEFEVLLPLKACELQFTVGLSTYEHPFYYVEHVGHVSLSEIAVDAQPFRASGAGILQTPQIAEIRRVEES